MVVFLLLLLLLLCNIFECRPGRMAARAAGMALGARPLLCLFAPPPRSSYLTIDDLEAFLPEKEAQGAFAVSLACWNLQL